MKISEAVAKAEASLWKTETKTNLVEGGEIATLSPQHSCPGLALGPTERAPLASGFSNRKKRTPCPFGFPSIMGFFLEAPWGLTSPGSLGECAKFKH